MLTQEQLKEILYYDPETGVFTWKIPRARKMKVGDVAGCVNSKGYIMIYYKMRCYISHRLAWLYMTGSYPDVIDHVDGCKTNNKFRNLRNVTHIDNCRNMGIGKRNTSGIIGVYALNDGQWLASIGFDRANKYLGTFKLKEDAIKARKDAEIKYGFHENHGCRYTT